MTTSNSRKLKGLHAFNVVLSEVVSLSEGPVSVNPALDKFYRAEGSVGETT